MTKKHNLRLDYKLEDAEYVYNAMVRRQKWTERKHRRWEIFRTRRVEKYGEKNKLRRERGKQKRMEFRELVANSPDWIFLNDWGCWVEKKDLLDRHVQGVMTALQNNPSFTNEQKRRMLKLTISGLKRAAAQPPAKVAMWESIFEEFTKRVPGQQSPPDEWFDEELTMPTSYEAIIAAAEAEIPQEELKRKYEPPASPYAKPIQY